MAINKEWHEKHKMPKNPSFEQKMEWHIEHSKHCNCYPLSEKIKEELKQYKSKMKKDKS